MFYRSRTVNGCQPLAWQVGTQTLFRGSPRLVEYCFSKIPRYLLTVKRSDQLAQHTHDERTRTRRFTGSTRFKCGSWMEALKTYKTSSGRCQHASISDRSPEDALWVNRSYYQPVARWRSPLQRVVYRRYEYRRSLYLQQSVFKYHPSCNHHGVRLRLLSVHGFVCEIPRALTHLFSTHSNRGGTLFLGY